ncbi:hypothetical protein [Roseateles sp. BYS87W]|uniref:Uncharacterized protein n=1 Tax=Pelomonas baiyunensis TaxID=3299026 RepID=A0ABW7GZW9_9BURK
MALKKDFEFIASLSSDFFQRAHIKKTLKAINDSEMTGWEKWLQIELAAFLEARDDIKAWWRESSYEMDKRLVESRKRCAVDFLVHQKWKQSHMALELKQVNSPTACVQGMIRDKKKIDGIKSAKYDIRSVWCVGVHRAVDPAEVARLVAYYGSKLNSPVNPKLLSTERIGYSPYMFTIF